MCMVCIYMHIRMCVRTCVHAQLSVYVCDCATACMYMRETMRVHMHISLFLTFSDDHPWIQLWLHWDTTQHKGQPLSAEDSLQVRM